MAKGQKRGNREVKKPKAVKKVATVATASQYQLPTRAPAKSSGK